MMNVIRDIYLQICCFLCVGYAKFLREMRRVRKKDRQVVSSDDDDYYDYDYLRVFLSIDMISLIIISRTRSLGFLLFDQHIIKSKFSREREMETHTQTMYSMTLLAYRYAYVCSDEMQEERERKTSKSMITIRCCYVSKKHETSMCVITNNVDLLEFFFPSSRLYE